MANKGHQQITPQTLAVQIEPEIVAPNKFVKQVTSARKRPRRGNASTAPGAKKIKLESKSPIDSAVEAPVSPVSNVSDDSHAFYATDDPNDSEPEEGIKPESTTTFFDLPPELRDEIYRLVLPVGEPIDVVPTFPHLRRPRLLAVNRLIRAEASAIFYQTNLFQIQGTSFCNRFLRSTSDDVLQALRCVRVLNSDTARLDDWSKKWLQYVKKNIVHLQDTHDERGLKAGVIRYSVTVDGGQLWVNTKDMESIVVRSDGCLTLQHGGV